MANSIDQDISSKQVVVVTKEENPSFLKQSIQLQKMLKKLTKVSDEAIEVLVKGLSSEDEKTRTQCAKTLLEFQVAVADKVNQDTMQRLIAEIKLNRAPSTKLLPLNQQSQEDEEVQKPAKPLVDFTTVRTI